MADNRIQAFAQGVPIQSVAYGALGEDARAVTAAAPLPVYGPGGLMTVTASFSRPSDMTAYATGDLVANSTTTGAVLAVELVGAARVAGEAMRIERVRLRKSGQSLSNAAFRVHLFRKAPAATIGDNGVFSAAGVLALSDIEGHVGWADVTMDVAAATGARGAGLPAVGAGITCEPTGGPGHDTSLWALIEARAAYAPASAETFTLTLEGARS